jgi:hypothetical protein
VTAFRFVEVGSGDVLDTVTFGVDAISYDTGEARDLVANRLRLAGGDIAQAAASLDGWSNGYLTAERLD